jgi:predicted acylesterase/phospholipase RssA
MHGAVALTDAWLKKDTSSNIAVYVVWSPQLGAQERHVAGATALVPDARARHYWDGGMLVGTAYQPLLGLPAAAWDTWVLFDRDAMWRGDTPPKPAWWEHQLSKGPPELHLDPERFASHAEALESVTGSHR